MFREHFLPVSCLKHFADLCDGKSLAPGEPDR
jgi:hypothetical protein